MGIIFDTCRKLAEAGNTIEVILEAVKAMEDGAAPPRGKKAKDGSPRLELERVMSSEDAQAVLDHRQRLRAPLTPQAARALADEFAKLGNPTAIHDAVNYMQVKGWRGFQVEWMPKAQARAPVSAMDQRKADLRQRIENGSGSERGGNSAPAGYLPYR